MRTAGKTAEAGDRWTETRIPRSSVGSLVWVNCASIQNLRGHIEKLDVKVELRRRSNSIVAMP